MASTKKSSQIPCLKCGNLLTSQNWSKSDRKIGYYICKECRKVKDKNYHKTDPDYNKKQRGRYRMRRSAVIFYYGNQCAKCQEDNYSKLIMCRIGKGNVDINHLYNELVDKNTYNVLCYNCRCRPISDKTKQTVITHYGAYCIDCGEDKIECLTLNCKMTAKLYRQIIKDNFPDKDEFVVLCFNCRHGRTDNLSG